MFSQQRPYNRGFSTTGMVVGFIIVALIAAVAYIQWGSATTGPAPEASDIVQSYESVDSFQHNTNLNMTAQLDPEALQDRPDAQRLQQFLQYVPNIGESQSGFPSQLSVQLGLSGPVAVGSATSSSARSNITLSIGSDQPEEVLAVEWRQVDGMNYLRGDTLPSIGFISLDQYEGQWYSASSSNPADVSGFGSMSPSAQLPGDVEGTQISPETARELTAAMVSEGVVRIENKTRAELRSGAPAWRFDLAFNPERAEDYRQAAKDIISENHPEIASSSVLFTDATTAQELESNLQQLQDQLDQFSIWVDRNSSRIRRVVVESELTQSELEEQVGTSTTAGVTGATITLDVGLSNYNQSVDVEVPDDATPLQSIFGMQQMPAEPTGAGGSVPSPMNR